MKYTTQQPADSSVHRVYVLLLQVWRKKQWKKKMKKKRESGCHAPAWMKMYKMPSLVLFWHITPKSSQESWIRAISWYRNDNASIAEKLLPVEARKDVKECINMHLTYILRTGIPLV